MVIFYSCLYVYQRVDMGQTFKSVDPRLVFGWCTEIYCKLIQDEDVEQKQGAKRQCWPCCGWFELVLVISKWLVNGMVNGMVYSWVSWPHLTLLFIHLVVHILFSGAGGARAASTASPKGRSARFSLGAGKSPKSVRDCPLPCLNVFDQRLVHQASETWPGLLTSGMIL